MFSVRAVGAQPVVSVHQHVVRRKSSLLQPLAGIRDVLLCQPGRFRVMRPDFGIDRVFVVAVFFTGKAAVGRVLLYVVLDLIELLTSVVHRVVLRGSHGEGGSGVDRRWAGTLFTPMSHAPQEHRCQRQNPDCRHYGNQQWHQVVYIRVLLLSALHADLSNGADDAAVGAVFAHQVDDAVSDVFDGHPSVHAILSHMDGNMDLVIGDRRCLAAHGD